MYIVKIFGDFIMGIQLVEKILNEIRNIVEIGNYVIFFCVYFSSMCIIMYFIKVGIIISNYDLILDKGKSILVVDIYFRQSKK